MSLKTTPFDLVEWLNSKATIQEYFRQVVEDGDSAEIAAALGYIARAHCMVQVTKEAGLGSKSLYKALRPEAIRYDPESHPRPGTEINRRTGLNGRRWKRAVRRETDARPVSMK